MTDQPIPESLRTVRNDWLLEFSRTKDGPLTPLGDSFCLAGFDAGYAAARAESQAEIAELKNELELFVLAKEAQLENPRHPVTEEYARNWKNPLLRARALLAKSEEGKR